MSSYYKHDIKCPNCQHTPILCADDTPRHREYTYICEQCQYQTQQYISFMVKVYRDSKTTNIESTTIKSLEFFGIKTSKDYLYIPNNFSFEDSHKTLDGYCTLVHHPKMVEKSLDGVIRECIDISKADTEVQSYYNFIDGDNLGDDSMYDYALGHVQTILEHLEEILVKLR